MHTYTGIENSSMELKSLETAVTHEREGFFQFCIFSYVKNEVTSDHSAKKWADDVRKVPIRDLLLSIHKTRGFDWQTAHTKGCQEIGCDFPNDF